MGIDEIFKKSTLPKETNRQIGPLFKRWIQKETLGIEILPIQETLNTNKNCIIRGTDSELMLFAKQYLNYQRTKGIDFLARMKGRYIVGEAKFLTDFGGHQNAQFEDAKNLLTNRRIRAITIAILDGVLYIKGNNKMYKYLKNHRKEYNILSSLVLREFLFHIT